MPTTVDRTKRLVRGLFLEAKRGADAGEGDYAYAYVVTPPAGDQDEFQLWKVLIRPAYLTDRYEFGEWVDLVNVEWLTTTLYGRSVRWIRALTLRYAEDNPVVES
jgi:hypothetical protein